MYNTLIKTGNDMDYIGPEVDTRARNYDL